MDRKELPSKIPEINFDKTRMISTASFEEYKKVESIKWKKMLISFGSLSLLFGGFIFGFLIYEFSENSSPKLSQESFDVDKKVRNSYLRVNNDDGIHLHETNRSPASVQKFYYHDTIINDSQYDYQDASAVYYDQNAYDEVPSNDTPEDSSESVAVGEVYEPQPSQDEGQFMVEPETVGQ